MKKALVVFMLVFLAVSGSAAEKLKIITMKDASVIIGSVVEMKAGKYTVETTALGQLIIDEDNIVEIRTLTADEEYQESAVKNSGAIKINDGSKRKPPRSPAREKYESRQENHSSGSSDMARQQEEVNSRVKSMTADGGFLNSLMDLSENNNMMDVMSDPEIMDAISRNDYDFLMNNEKMKNLMESSEIRDLLGDM